MSPSPSARVRAMLAARTVAVVGAGDRPGSFGERLTTEILRSPGVERVHLVSPTRTTAFGRPCVPSLADVPEPVDLVMLGIPDYNPRIKQIDGRLFPTGVIRLLWNRRAITKARVVSANVLPEFQQWGVGLALMAELEREIVHTSVQEAEFSWVLEDNHLSRRSLEHGGAIKQKTYRIYERAAPWER